MGGHPLLDLTSVEADDVEVFLRDLGKVFVVHRGHDSNNTSAGVEIGGRRWFVKWATDPEAVSHLECAVRFHTVVSHRRSLDDQLSASVDYLGDGSGAA